ncbi:integrase [Paenibacillus anaericanus]|uniref:tyrosine-type recombinase/integrase n=1 Tax=Paenibacillus anaericanus TaxID=170367 RepID=UPI00278B71C6|nr:site-specific integrase [Paenibacillus anaericanus]MDQ0086748.1 integrase [Paenibacillus anaericanus]
MKGSLSKKGTLWYMIIETKDELGNRKQKWINTKCEKKTDANKVLRETLGKIDNNTFSAPRKLSFTTFLLDWLHNVVINTVETTTWESYELVLNKHVIPYVRTQLNDIQLNDLQPIHIQRYYDFKLASGLSGNTLRKHHANIKSALDFGVRMNLISTNPSDKILLPKKVKFESNYYSVEQLERLFEACVGTPIESAVYIAAHYGLRRGEVLGLKFDAISFNQKTLTIRETRVKYGKNTVTKKPKSASSYRTLPLIEKIKDYLEILLKQQKHNKKVYGDEYDKSGFVCCWPDGSPLKSEYLNHKFKQILAENDLPPIRFHDLRHSTASYLLKHGMSLKEIQVWLGHADIGTTANIYAHIDTEMKVNTAQKINDIFSKNRQTDTHPVEGEINDEESSLDNANE